MTSYENRQGERDQVEGGSPERFVEVKPSPLDPLLYCQGRLLDLVHRLAIMAPEDKDRRRAEEIVDASYRRLLELAEAPEEGEEGAVRSLLEGLRGVIDSAESLAKLVPEEGERVSLSEELFLPPKAPLVNPPIIAITGGPPPTEPPWWYWELTADEVRRLFEALIRILREIEQAAKDPATRERVRQMIAALTAYLAQLSQGGKIFFHNLWRWLIEHFLPLLRPILRGLGRAGVRFAISIASAIWSFLESIGISLGAEAGAGAAAAGAGVIAAVLAALIGGHLIGKWIGSLEYEGKTVDDWLADGIFLYYFDDPDECKDLWDLYVQARSARIAYESSGPTLDKSRMVPMLAREIRILRKYLNARCPDTGGSIRRVLVQLEQQLARLS